MDLPEFDFGSDRSFIEGFLGSFPPMPDHKKASRAAAEVGVDVEVNEGGNHC